MKRAPTSSPLRAVASVVFGAQVLRVDPVATTTVDIFTNPQTKHTEDYITGRFG